jgi:hypothetical protein
MSPQMGRQALQYATWTVLVAAVLLCFLEKGSAEFIITVISLGMGLIFGLVVWVLTRRSLR